MASAQGAIVVHAPSPDAERLRRIRLKARRAKELRALALAISP